MANDNSTGAPTPTQPINPFIVPGRPEDTCGQIDAVLAFLQEYAQGQTFTNGHTYPASNAFAFGLIYVLDGVRDAVKYLSHLDAVPTDNVTKLEVDS